MEPAESRACLRILLAVARADGHVDPDEAKALEVLTHAIDDAAEAPRKSDVVDVDAELVAVTSPTARRMTFEAAVAIAELDGKCTPEEHRLLERLRQAFALDQELELEADEAKWVRSLKRPRAVLEKLTSSFLRTVADAQEAGELTEPRYEQLVADLRAKRTALLADVLADVKTT